MALNERDVRRIAWDNAEIAEKENNISSEIKGNIAKDVANAFWQNLYPDKELWKNVPQKP